MAEAQGSSSGGAGSGDFMKGGVGPHVYQALLASVQGAPSPFAPNVQQQQRGHGHYNPAGLIHQPAPMPAVPEPPPYAPQLADQTQPPTSPQLYAQPINNNVLPGGYQYWDAAGSHNEVAAQPVPSRLGSMELEMYNSTYMPIACGSTCGRSNNISNNNGYHYQGLRPSSTTTNTFYSAYSTPGLLDLDHHQAASYQNNIHEKDSGFLSSFSVDSPLVSSPCFPPISSLSNVSSMQFYNEATYMKGLQREAMYTQKMKYSEDPPDMESENSDEQLYCTPVVDLPTLSPLHEGLTVRFSCRGYSIIVRKVLSNSDVGNIGRMVIPKKYAEAHLPPLVERDRMILRMDDFKLPITWNFKYRYWPNNKSRMYLLECVDDELYSPGEFVKSHGLQAGDTLIIYKNPEPCTYLVRGEKATRQNAPLLCQECKERNGIHECGFTMTLHTRRT